MNAEGSPAPVRLQGLTTSEVDALRAEFGENRLPTEGRRSAVWILLGQFRSPLIYIILVAAVISLLLGEVGDFAIIMVVLVINVALGFYQEFRAQRMYQALKGLLKPTAVVIRDGSHQEVEVWQLVPGDLVSLSAGDKVPADGTILEANRLAIDEAILTGESEPVSKHSSAPGQENELTRAFMGSTVIAGRALIRVTSIGLQTELGAIASSLSHKEAPTPLQERLAGFTKMLTWIVLTATVVILVLGMLLGRSFIDSLRNAIILAIAAVPEGLVIAVTVILALGAQQILKRRGLVKRLLAVETLGSVTVICTDKTGTLTAGRMKVNRTHLLDETRAWQAMVYCNNLQGPVEIALWDYAESTSSASAQGVFDVSHRIAEAPFSSESKYMAVCATGGDLGDGRPTFLKGAPEIVLDMCDLAPEERAGVLSDIDEWAREGLRVLGLAFREGGTVEDTDGYRWVGMLGLEDPLRPGAYESVQTAQTAGIAVKMVTGDYRGTAEAIAGKLGIVGQNPALEGAEIEKMTDAELQQRVKTTAVFARIRPQDKLRIIRALTAEGEITAMIGDGVNDAPALTQAHIGVAVGGATDIAKESADLVLLDDDFGTVVSAVEEGRVIFDNVRKVIAYILAGTFTVMLIIVGGMLLGWPAPLLVVQILWLNLICDGPSDLVLGFEPKERGIMRRPPHGVKEPLLSRLGLVLVIVIVVCSTAFTLTIFGYFHLVLDDPLGGRSMVLASLAVNSMVYIFAYRSLTTPLLRMPPVTANKPLIAAVGAGLLAIFLPYSIPALGDLMGVAPLSWAQWALVGAFAAFVLVMVESAKVITARRGRSGT